VVNFSVPESARSRRHQLRAHLTALGFGNIGTALWIAPARMLAAAERAIDELDLTRYAAVFVGDYAAGQDLGDMLYQGWDLVAIDHGYRDFTGRYRDQPARLAANGTVEPSDAFVLYLEIIDHWRKLPFRDPGLPQELLADDWSAPQAGALFEELVGLLDGRALAYAAGFWPDAQPCA
jgi:phenylacetic acid degradation operon negative regulatory protein